MAGSAHKGNGHGHATETPDVSHIKNVDVTHEASDVSISGILKFVVGLTILTGVVYVLMLLLFNLMNAKAVRSEQASPPGPMALTEKERLPPEPRLQGAKGFAEDLAKTTGGEPSDKPRDPMWEIRVLRQLWTDNLEHGLRDPNGNIVGLPIEEAMKRVVEGNSLPVRPNVESSEQGYVERLPTAASSGRMSETRPQ
ncbi:MAG TPA: hypothetical protein VJ124_06370 [Pyrinomonadaceae bacterium]|nr:hypothetical protein [Pyrinomonadaceae bacterium]